MNNELKLISFDNVNVKQIELKIDNTFKWKYCKKLLTLSKVNNSHYQVIMVFDGMQIDLYYCDRLNIAYAIQEINKYYYCFQEINYIDIELV